MHLSGFLLLALCTYYIPSPILRLRTFVLCYPTKHPTITKTIVSYIVTIVYTPQIYLYLQNVVTVIVTPAAPYSLLPPQTWIQSLIFLIFLHCFEKNYIAFPKENGYRSLHLILEIPIFLSNGKKPMRIEVQIRTIAMDFWASLEHQLKYKKDIEKTEEISAELKECAEIIAATDLRMQEIRKKLN